MESSLLDDLDDACVDFVTVLLELSEAMHAILSGDELLTQVKKEKSVQMLKDALKHGDPQDLLTSLAEAIVQSQFWKEKHEQCLSAIAQASIHEAKWKHAEDIRSGLGNNNDGLQVVDSECRIS